MGIEIGVHRWTFGRCTTLESSLIARALGFNCMDLGNALDFDPDYIVNHINEESSRFNKIKEETGVRFIDAVPQFEPVFGNNHPDCGIRKNYIKKLKRFFEFAARIGLEGVTLSPGKYWPGESEEDSFKRGIEELHLAILSSCSYGIKVRVEPHIQSIAWTPGLMLKILKQIDGLTLTLDYSHFAYNCLPYGQIQILNGYASHWHARQARGGKLQCKYIKKESLSTVVSPAGGILLNCCFSSILCIHKCDFWLPEARDSLRTCVE